MNVQETGIIMDILETAYPRFYAGKSPAEQRKALLLWAEMFAGDDVAIVAAAVKALISADVKGFPPVIGQVKDYIRTLTAPKGLTADEAWGIVTNAVRNGLYGSKEEFERLPEDVRRIVGSPSQLREWALMNSETFHSVVASNFQRAYRTRQEADKRFAALPEDVKALVQRIGAPEISAGLPSGSCF